MSSIPIIKSKLIMPELNRNLVLTERMKILHDKLDACKAAYICAPAGYGKTALVVSYISSQDDYSHRVCWYRIDPEDKNLSIFITHLTESLFPSEIPEFEEFKKAVEEYVDMKLQPQQAIAMICQEMWSLSSRSKYTHTSIVLDDFHNVAEIPEISHMISYLLDNLPADCRMFLLSRATLNVFTEKQMLEKSILDMSVTDLAYNNYETKEFIRGLGHAVPAKKLLDTIVRNTEGWIAGIIILCQAFKNKTFDSPSFIADKLCHEDALFRYISAEVFKSIDFDTQNIISRLALLQDFSEKEAAEIFEINNLSDLLESCLSFGMFIQRIPGSPVVYRFHSLFREFLLHILKNRYSEVFISDLNLKAAKYYIDHSTYSRAAEHMARCRNCPAALEMVIGVGFNKFLIGETAQLKVWLDLLPESMILNNPILLMYKAQLLSNSRQPEMVKPLQEVIEQSLNDNELEIYFNISTVLLYILICINDMKGLQEMTPDISGKLYHASEELKNKIIILDMVKSISEEKYSLAEEQCEGIIYDRLPEDCQWLYLVLCCIIYYCLGKLDKGEYCMKKALILQNFKRIEPARGFILLFLATIMSLKNKRADMQTYIEEINNIGEKYDYDYLIANAKRLAAYNNYMSLDTEVSAEMLDYAIFHYSQISNKAMVATCKLLRILWTINSGNAEQYLEEAIRDFDIVQKAQPGIMINEISISLLGAIARESDNYELSEKILLEAIHEAKSKRGYQVLCGSYFHIAKLYFSRGDTPKGHCYLKQAMELAAGNKYFMFWDIHIPTLVELLLRSIRYGYCTNHAEELLEKIYTSVTVKYLAERVKSMDESQIHDFIRGFLSIFKLDRPQQLYFTKATLFGKPEISINGTRIPDSEWKTKKVKSILEYLLLSNGSIVSKEVLSDILWPEADSKSAASSLRTALYHLRKIFSKYNAEVTGSNAFIYETLDGLQIRKNDLLELDISEFLNLHTELTRLTNNSSQVEQRRLAILQRMFDLYKGDLMEGSDYGELIFYEREKFKAIFIESCNLLSMLYKKYGEFHKAEDVLRRALSTEPYNENICLELIKLYIMQGRKSKAVKFYYSFKKLLEQELDITIDKRLTDAIKHI
jgi:LuxR family maltose regulon positive regulatory protein